jgi:TolA-binding protein
MNALARRAAALLLFLFLLLLPAPALQSEARSGENPAREHLEAARRHWERMEVAAAVGEWRRVLELDAANAEARRALELLAPAFERTDEFLGVAESMLDRGLTAEADDALRRCAIPYASRDQQARVLTLKGRLQLARGETAAALASFRAAGTVAESAPLALAARLGGGRALAGRPETRPEGAELLAGLAAEAAGTALAAEASWAWLEARDLSPEQLAGALRKYAADFPEGAHAAEAWRRLAGLPGKGGSGSAQSPLEAWLAAYAAAPDLAGREAACSGIVAAVEPLNDAAVLEWLSRRLEQLPAAWELQRPPLELAALAWRRAATVGRGEAALKFARASQAAGRRLLAEGPADARRQRWQELAAQSRLVEGQILLLAGREGEALTVLFGASAAYQELLAGGDRSAGGTLLRIGRILESRGRADGAAHHYELVARSFVADPLGADSLRRLASVYRRQLDLPLEAIAVLQRYQDLYPPSFRVPTTARERIARLGYPDVTGFQSAHGLKADGVLGPDTLAAMRAEEENFREVLPGRAEREPVRGQLVHDEVFGIAEELRARGRFAEAVRAYQSFLAMYPGHRLSDDALLAVARVLRENDLQHEAAAAYDRLIADHPGGDATSHAYLEAAFCHECLGDWRRAEELCDLYLKKFPQYSRAAEAKRKLEAVRRLIRYDELLAEPGLAPGKRADALYETGRLLYRELENRQKAAEVFVRVAGEFGGTYHGPDARFTAGVCLLHEENFEAAREQFALLVRDHPGSRLADDAQFWIGHTCEYQARALGELDRQRIVLKRRSAQEAARLRGDLELRRVYWPEAAAAPGEAWHRPHPDLSATGRTRERVLEGLRLAVAAYRQTVDRHPLGDMAQRALLRIGIVRGEYLNDPGGAIAAYSELLEKYPGSTEAVDAQFAVGRHYLDDRKLGEAEKAITLFLTSFPNHARAADALLLLAECHRGQREWAKALDDCQSFLSRYPGSPRAGQIREEIEWLKKYRF